MSNDNYYGSYGTSKQAALAVLEPVLDEILRVHELGDYDGFCALITESFQRKISSQSFYKAYQDMRPTLGKLIAKRFVAGLRRGEDPMLIYMATYDAVPDDVLIRVTFANKSNPPRISWLWIE
jgi:hypothetical protein